MELRDIALTLIVFGLLPAILWRPWIGILVWSWLSYMNPHRQTWGFAYDLPFAQIVAITLLVSLFFNREPMRLRFNTTMVLWCLFLAWMGISTVFAVYPDDAVVQLEKVYKIQLVTFLTMLLITDHRRINALIWVISLSIGYYSIKGGVFTLATGGAHRVWGPAGTFISDNNHLAVACLMIAPLFYYLRGVHSHKPLLKQALIAFMLLTTVSAIGSQSRGALLATAAICGFFWLRSSRKLVSGTAIACLAALLFVFMPDSWHERMGSISNYREDNSAMGRLNSWQYAINAASDRLTGAGFESWSPQTFALWAPDPSDVHAAHSIYFGVLADHGWPGLMLFLVLLLRTWRSLGQTIRATAAASQGTVDAQRNLLARMLQLSLLAYASGGAFLSLAYFDLPWHVIALALLLEEQRRQKNPVPQPVIDGARRPLY